MYRPRIGWTRNDWNALRTMVSAYPVTRDGAEARDGVSTDPGASSFAADGHLTGGGAASFAVAAIRGPLGKKPANEDRREIP
jgi:hypothetical protein